MCFQQPRPAPGLGAAGGARVGLGEPAWAGTAPSLPSPCPQHFEGSRQAEKSSPSKSLPPQPLQLGLNYR